MVPHGQLQINSEKPYGICFKIISSKDKITDLPIWFRVVDRLTLCSLSLTGLHSELCLTDSASSHVWYWRKLMREKRNTGLKGEKCIFGQGFILLWIQFPAGIPVSRLQLLVSSCLHYFFPLLQPTGWQWLSMAMVLVPRFLNVICLSL